MADAMRVAPHCAFAREEIVVGESCGDVDMGTPTATNSLGEWRASHARNGDLPVDAQRLDRWRIHGDDIGNDIGNSRPPMAMASSSFSRGGAVCPVDERRRPVDEGASVEDGTVEIQAFREYNDADIDSLDIFPSQDFGGEAVDGDDSQGAVHTTRSSQPESCAWLDLRDGTQLRDEEASEVFDNVIYAPSTLPPRVASACPPRRASPSPTLLQNPLHDPNDLYESESELSDAENYEVPPTTSSPPKCSAPAPPSSTGSSAGGSPRAASVQWCSRTSVKRDCSFIDHTLKHRRKQLSVQDLSESGEEFEEKLKLVDGDDDAGAGRQDYGSGSKAVSRQPSSSAVVDAGLLLPGFRPKKKRRKVRQLALDAFSKPQSGSASY